MELFLSEWWGTIFIVVAPFLLPNAVVENAFYVIGKSCTHLLRQRVGRDATQRIEGHVRGTMDAAMTGMTNGMKYEDE